MGSAQTKNLGNNNKNEKNNIEIKIQNEDIPKNKSVEFKEEENKKIDKEEKPVRKKSTKNRFIFLIL